MTKYIDALKNNDTTEFQKLVEQKISTVFHKLMESIEIETETAEEINTINDININAEGLGATDITYKEGIMTVYLTNKEGAIEFASYLDDNDNVESYEFNILHDEDEPVEVGEIDIEDITDDLGYEFEFIIELDPEIVNYSDDYTSDSDYDELSESKKITKLNELTFRKAVNNLGKITKKAVCGPGQKFKDGHCVAMKSAEKQARKKAGIHAAKERRGIMAKIAKKVARASMFRKQKLG
ncbi:MAG: hypothetical protein PHC28_08970 [Flavobacterium sp.]|uniref:hypothetical protein n=1 Tax=Flavobacterium sp. TaxID=239 RepID=UPI00260B6784|nr:hypothetical protein [Flavobacterium sp.]MDD5150600.1 hypothetical protein [Flavobacterium sp.]